MSVMVGVVAAEIPDGDGTNGIDRNGNTPSEKDGASITRNVDATNGLSGETVTLNKMDRQGQNTAGATLNYYGFNKIGTVGKALPKTEIKIADDGSMWFAHSRGGVSKFSNNKFENNKPKTSMLSFLNPLAH